MKIRFILIMLVVPVLLKAQKLLEPNFGMILNANFSTIHIPNENYVGRGMGSLGAYFQSPITPYHTNRYLNRLDYIAELGLSWMGFRDFATDKRFQSNFVDLSLYLNYVPDKMSDDLRLFVGVRPSYLTFTQTSVIDFGVYKDVSQDTQNLNVLGDIDYSGIIGVSVNMGSVASLELKYVHSFTNQSTPSTFKGRPSAVEIGIRLSAIRLRDKLVVDETNMVNDLNKRAQGTMLFMLEEADEKLINTLVQEKRVSDANFVRNLQTQTNLNIMRELRANFDFCKVEFFMNSKAHQVNKGDFNGVFVDDQLQPKELVSFDSTNYFIGSFVEDVSEYTRKPDYGLYLYDKNFVQLPKPYNTQVNNLGIYVGGDPMNYFRRVKTSGYFPEDFRKVIRKVNGKLQLGRIPVVR
ncbi:MAG: hypothetical protein SGJ00_01200 [bacterium]|nr:hypothetical protein [bacterium]